MLPVVLAVALVASAAAGDTALRVPGTALRFGLADSVLTARGFPLTKGAHRGTCRFFGVPAEATLTLASGVLAEAKLRVQDASPAQVAYVQDQLTAMGYRRRCQRLEPGAFSCEWTGRAVVQLESNERTLSATVRPPGPAPARGEGQLASLAPVAPGAAPPAEPPMAPDTLALPIPGLPGRHAPAVATRTVAPAYPREARRAGVQGRVWVVATVDANGRVTDAAVERGVRELDQAALEAVRGYTFQPRTWNGAPCRTRVLVPVLFTLH